MEHIHWDVHNAIAVLCGVYLFWWFVFGKFITW